MVTIIIDQLLQQTLHDIVESSSQEQTLHNDVSTAREQVRHRSFQIFSSFEIILKNIHVSFVKIIKKNLIHNV